MPMLTPGRLHNYKMCFRWWRLMYEKLLNRAALAASVKSSVFFAGEATHAAVNPCLQAAFETGESAAREILSTLGCPRAKL